MTAEDALRWGHLQWVLTGPPERWLPSDGPLFRVRVLENPVEAMVASDALREADIPHAIESYWDTAYGPLFQMHRGWGAVLVREENAARAAQIVAAALDAPPEPDDSPQA